LQLEEINGERDDANKHEDKVRGGDEIKRNQT